MPSAHKSACSWSRSVAFSPFVRAVPALRLLACPPCLGCQALVGEIEENVVWERKGDWRGKIGVLASWRWRGLASTAAQLVAAS